MSVESEIARELAPAVLQGVWPVIYSAGFAGVVCLVLLWILYKTLSRHTEAQIKNTEKLETISEDLKEIVKSLRDMERFIERRRE